MYSLPEIGLPVEYLGGSAVCFCRATGETHLLNAIPAEVLHFLAQGAQARSAIVAHIAAIADVPVSEIDPQVTAALGSLQHLQLLEMAQ